jgi:hypothetical protein
MDPGHGKVDDVIVEEAIDKKTDQINNISPAMWTAWLPMH